MIFIHIHGARRAGGWAGRISSLFVMALMGLVLHGQAQLTAPENKPVLGARMPALSPDGEQLAFVYRGDIWIVSSQGGRAMPLTQHVESERYPMFSPDGNWVAFASKRNGDWDMFAIPAQGGQAQQLTFHGQAEIAFGWSPDGQKLLFSGRRDQPRYSLYTVDVNTLQNDQLCQDYAPMNYPVWSPDGATILYGRYGFPWTRPRYHGSAAAEIWLYEVESKTRRPVTESGRQHLWPKFLPDGRQFVAVTVGEETPSSSPLDRSIESIKDSPARTPNLWKFNLEGQGNQITFFSGGSVRSPTVAARSGDIVFEYDTDLWLLRADHDQAEIITLFAAADEKQTTQRREELTSGVSEAEPSPDGKTIAFGLKGEIWSIPVDKPKGVAGRNSGYARRLTDWAGDDSDFSWSQDGKKLFFTSDRHFNTRIYELDLETLKVASIWNRMEDVTGLRVSPDGKQLAFWVSGKEGGLWLWTLATGESRRIVKVPGPHWRGMGGGSFSWSPDMKWIAYTFRGESRAWNIWIVPGTGGKPTNITQLYASHSQPAWSPDGKYLFFQSNREGDGLYVLPLQPESIRTDDTDIRYVKPTNTVDVVIDFEDISRRIRKVSSQRPQADLKVTEDGSILYLSGGDIWSTSFDGRDNRRLTSGGAKLALRMDAKGRKLFYMHNRELWTVNRDGKGARKVDFKADWERNVRDERRAAFTQFWRSYHRGFYDPNFHGRDWENIRTKYEPLLEAVETEDEFATLLQMMVGELDTSHAEVTASKSSTKAAVTPHVGFTFDYSHPGPGIKVAEVPEGAPGSYEKTRIREGEFVLAINGEEVRTDEALYRFINDKQGREFEFLVNDKPEKEGARTVKYKVLSQKDWNSLLYRNRVDDLRDYVETRSESRVGYIHISAMGIQNQARFEREIYEYMVDKEALVIDVRFNTGGNIADTLVDWLERKPHGFFRPRDSAVESSPYRAWDKPIIVVMNEHSYSNSEMFAYAMRARKLAQLVGNPTPGYVIWTSSLSLVNGTGARMPQSGFYRLDGTPQENNGEQPDVLVGLSPGDWLDGRDPQLDKAIEMLLPESKALNNDKVARDQVDNPSEQLTPEKKTALP